MIFIGGRKSEKLRIEFMIGKTDNRWDRLNDLPSESYS